MNEESIPVPENPASALCYSQWQRVYQQEIAKGEHWVNAAKRAGLAYRKAMPSLSGEENIRDFVTCVAHGMLIGAIEGKDASKLLYAAQVASGLRVKAAPSQAAPPTHPLWKSPGILRSLSCKMHVLNQLSFLSVN